jgi:plasmid stabilization system protein ParE
VDFKLIWTDSAIDDLGAIVRYVSSTNGPDVARSIGFEIYDRAQILKRFPEAGSVLPEKDSPYWRKLVVRSWKIAYKVDYDAKVTYVARVWHASRDEIELK